MKPLWENRVCPNVIYSMKHLCRDTSTLVVGGIDGVLRILDQNTGKVVSGYVMDDDSPTPPASSLQTGSIIERKKGRRITEDAVIYNMPKTSRPPITCLAVGMQKVVTTHNTKYIRMWNFRKEQSFQAWMSLYNYHFLVYKCLFICMAIFPPTLFNSEFPLS